MKRNANFAVFMLAITFLGGIGGNCQAASDGKTLPVNVGKWGGTHLEMDVTEQGASLEFDCAQGAITEPLLLDANGKFHARGTFHPQHGGPIRKDEIARNIDIVYSGTVHGDTMELEFAVDSASPQKFVLVRGKNGKLTRCA